MINKDIFLEIELNKTNLAPLINMVVKHIEEYKDEDDMKCIIVLFESGNGEEVTLYFDEYGTVSITPILTPLYAGQCMRELEGYTITKVVSDEIDGSTRVHLQNQNRSDIKVLHMDKALDGETLFIEGN